MKVNRAGRDFWQTNEHDGHLLAALLVSQLLAAGNTNASIWFACCRVEEGRLLAVCKCVVISERVGGCRLGCSTDVCAYRVDYNCPPFIVIIMILTALRMGQGSIVGVRN